MGVSHYLIRVYIVCHSMSSGFLIHLQVIKWNMFKYNANIIAPYKALFLQPKSVDILFLDENIPYST